MSKRLVTIADVTYDVDTQLSAAHQALLDEGQREACVYIQPDESEPDDCYVSQYVLRDSGTLHQVTRHLT